MVYFWHIGYMPRSVRIQYPGAVYHIMCRGDRREPIFLDDFDRHTFVRTLTEVCERTGFVVHAYVLMLNHYHFLMETPEPNLVVGMKWLQGTYTQRFNSRHKLAGHLFQGRYKAIPVDQQDPSYFRTIGEYIHLNPIRAGMLHSVNNKLEAYPWSSYPTLIKSDPLPDWLERIRLFSAHGLADDRSRNRKRFATIMRQRSQELLDTETCELLHEEWKVMRRGWFIGSEDFREEMSSHIERAISGSKRTSYHSETLRLHDETEAVRRLTEACKTLNVTLPEIWQRRPADPVKQGVAWHIKNHCVIEDQWICQKLEMRSRSNVQRAMRRFREAKDETTKYIRQQLTIRAD